MRPKHVLEFKQKILDETLNKSSFIKLRAKNKRAWTTRRQVCGKRGVLALIELGSWDLYQILISFNYLGIWRVFCKFFIFEPVVHYCPNLLGTQSWFLAYLGTLWVPIELDSWNFHQRFIFINYFEIYWVCLQFQKKNWKNF